MGGSYGSPILIGFRSGCGSFHSHRQCTGFTFLHILADTYPYLLESRHCKRHGVVPHCGFDLHVSSDSWHQASCRVSLGHLYVFFGKMPVQVLCPFLIGSFPCCWVLWLPYVVLYQLIIRCMICKYFLQFSRLYFQFLDEFYCCAETF